MIEMEKGLKKYINKALFSLLILTVLIFPLSSCKDRESSGIQEVNIYNWGEYMDKDLLRKFEEETGIKVTYTTFNTNEDLYVKLKNGTSGYDLIFPSDYMIERMRKEGMLREINFSNVPNIKYVDPEFLNLPYDPQQKYSVPYFWGTLGIVYNTEMVSEEEVSSWKVLWDEKYKREIIMLDSSRDSLGIALKYLGYSMNSRNEGELAEAEKLLSEQYPLVYAYLVDQTKDIMINGEAALAVMYSGDATEALFENESLAYSIPEEGSNLWFDSMVIPAGARNPENAEKFINFILEPENAAQNAEYVGYSLPSDTARNLQSEDYRDNEVSYPDRGILKNLEVYSDPGEFIKLYDDIWQEVKNQ